MKALNPKGKEPFSLFVGGCVRDSILGRIEEGEAPDIDIATKYTPEEVMKILEQAGIKTIPTGIDFGTVTAVTGTKTFEITTLRRDIDTDGRHAVVSYAKDWGEDAARRDFTMNTLLADINGRIYDPLGCGLTDLEDRCVKFVGEPAGRIAEDYLRILRFFRFYALYGSGEPDSEAFEACRQAAPKIALLSRERISQEFFKIINIEEPLPVLLKMRECGVLSAILPTDFPQDLLASLCDLQNEYGLASIASRLLVLIDMNVSNIDALESSLVLSNALKKEILYLNDAITRPGKGQIKSGKELIYRYSRIVAAQAMILNAAMQKDRIEELDEQIALVRNWMPPVFPLSGQDMIDAGYDSGPALGEKLAEIEKWWIENDFVPDREQCLNKIK